MDHGLTPLGTMAHEYLQACQAVGPRLRDSQVFAFNMWAREYRGDLGIALSDVCGMDAFLRDFDLFFCKLFDGVRHDSGDPFEWGEKLIAHYEKMRIDPRTKTMVFSDSLNMPLAIRLFEYFKGRVRTSFGIGTNLTNDLGYEPLQIVIKMTRCNGQPVAKISDEPSKTMDYDPSYVAVPARGVPGAGDAGAAATAAARRVSLPVSAQPSARGLRCKVFRWRHPIAAPRRAAPRRRPTATAGRAPGTKAHDRRLRLDDILKLMVADGLVPAADAEMLARSRTHRVRPSAGGDRRPEVEVAQGAQQADDARVAGRMARGQARRPVLPHRSAEDRPGRRHRDDVQRVRRALPHPAGRGRPDDAHRRHREPFMHSWANELGEILKLDVKFVFANPVDIKRFMGEFYNLARSMKRAHASVEGRAHARRNFEQLVELGKHGNLDANDQHVVHIVDWLWQYAFEQRASDIHIEPRRDVGLVRFRIDGVLHQVYAIPPPVLIAMTSRIKLLARMEIVEKRRPQDGRIKTLAPDGQEVELRISTMPTAFGEKLVMRIFTPEVLVRDYADLGFTPRRPRALAADDQASRTGSSSSPAPRAPARRRRCTRR